MIHTLRRDAQQPVQFLLFSATFNDKVKGFALKVVADNGREEANQVSTAAGCHAQGDAQLLQPVRVVLMTACNCAAGVHTTGGPVARCHQAVQGGEFCLDSVFWHVCMRVPVKSWC